MGGRPHPRSFLSRYRPRLFRLGLRDAFERDRFELGDRVSRQWPRGRRGRAASQAARSVNPADIYVDKLFRPDTAGSRFRAYFVSRGRHHLPRRAAQIPTNRGRKSCDCGRRFSRQSRSSTADKAYVVQVVAARTGMSQADAEKRINEATSEAKTAAERRGKVLQSFPSG